MISRQKIVKIFLWISIPILIVAMAAYRLGWISADLHSSILTAHLLNSLLFFLGHWLNRKGLMKSDKLFLIFVFGGQIARMLLALVLIILSLNLLNMSQKNFILVFFLFYFLFLSLEIYYLSKIKNFTRP
ncbi:MAG: hypothetical protein FMNOHCHN_00729 [Ignavibacteriaceae bacterium]|nr:hypothetical protein [Ignavibacteriaceae bacterium]